MVVIVFCYVRESSWWWTTLSCHHISRYMYWPALISLIWPAQKLKLKYMQLNLAIKLNLVILNNPLFQTQTLFPSNIFQSFTIGYYEPLLFWAVFFFLSPLTHRISRYVYWPALISLIWPAQKLKLKYMQLNLAIKLNLVILNNPLFQTQTLFPSNIFQSFTIGYYKPLLFWAVFFISLEGSK